MNEKKVKEEENYSKILNEKIVDDDLKLFLNKLNKERFKRFSK